ncbi:MAG: hypothetical protein AABY22_32840 [Nanoarchaeota archaeon]
MKNIQTKFFTSNESLNGWLKTFQGEILDIKLQSEVIKTDHKTDELISHWHHQFLVIYQQ